MKDPPRSRPLRPSGWCAAPESRPHAHAQRDCARAFSRSSPTQSTPLKSRTGSWGSQPDPKVQRGVLRLRGPEPAAPCVKEPGGRLSAHQSPHLPPELLLTAGHPQMGRLPPGLRSPPSLGPRGSSPCRVLAAPGRPAAWLVARGPGTWTGQRGRMWMETPCHRPIQNQSQRPRKHRAASGCRVALETLAQRWRSSLRPQPIYTPPGAPSRSPAPWEARPARAPGVFPGRLPSTRSGVRPSAHCLPVLPGLCHIQSRFNRRSQAGMSPGGGPADTGVPGRLSNDRKRNLHPHSPGAASERK